jgi:hypothetical protein
MSSEGGKKSFEFVVCGKFFVSEEQNIQDFHVNAVSVIFVYSPPITEMRFFLK